MKYFRLAGADFRKQIDLRLYQSDIEEAVKKVKPNAKVIVRQSYFTTIPDLGKRESIAVSATLRQHAMAELTTFRPCLFNSTPISTFHPWCVAAICS